MENLTAFPFSRRRRTVRDLSWEEFWVGNPTILAENDHWEPRPPLTLNRPGGID
jgi:hypothetical protein